MCGIIGYSGKNNAAEIIINGLYALEYRGYDSAGMSVFDSGSIKTVKTLGRVSELENKSKGTINNSNCGIGHTRWATHGRPSEKNAHPHGTENVMVVHNGIIENYREIKSFLQSKGYVFESDTDTEAAAKLIDYIYNYTKDELSAVQTAAAKLKGSFALGIIFKSNPNTIYAAKKDSPLLIGTGSGENFIASDILAFSKYTNRYIRLSDGDTARISDNKAEIFDSSGNIAERKAEVIEQTTENTEKNGCEHYMLKEIYDEPTAMKQTFDSISKNYLPDFSEFGIEDSFFENTENIIITACGTAMHAGLIGKYYIEKLARIRTTAELAGEFRYQDPIIGKNDLVIFISQSGETADTLAALRLVKSAGVKTLAIVNTDNSTIANEADKVIITKAGREIAVASTKAFSVQTEVLLMLAIKLALAKGKINMTEAEKYCKNIEQSFSKDLQEIFNNTDEIIKSAKIIAKHNNVFFIGRGADSYLSMEASLKLKEISYIHSEAYAAGELKHGTISLIEEGTPVIALAADEKHREKLCNNIEEVKGRGAFVIGIAGKNAEEIKASADIFINLPLSDSLTSIFSAAAAIQLLAYYTALELGRDIDKPRNLAKSVTVE